MKKALKNILILFVALTLSGILSACAKEEQKPTSKMSSNAASSTATPKAVAISPENKAAHAAYESALKAYSGPLSIFGEIKAPYERSLT